MCKNPIGTAEQGASELDVTRPAFVRQHVVADHDRGRGGRGRPAAHAPHDAQVGGYLDRRKEGEHGQVAAAAEEPPGPQPAVWPAPGEQPPGQRIRLALRLLDRLHARVERRRVHRPPRLDHHVVPGRREAVGEFGRMPCATALVGVSGPDQRDPHRCPIDPGPASRTSLPNPSSLTVQLVFPALSRPPLRPAAPPVCPPSPAWPALATASVSPTAQAEVTRCRPVPVSDHAPPVAGMVVHDPDRVNLAALICGQT